MNDDEFGYIKLLILKYRKGDQIIKTFFKVGSPQKLGLPSKKKSSESYRRHENLMNDEEFGSQEIKLPRFKQFSYSAKLVSHLISGHWVSS